MTKTAKKDRKTHQKRKTNTKNNPSHKKKNNGVKKTMIKTQIIKNIQKQMNPILTQNQYLQLTQTLKKELTPLEITNTNTNTNHKLDNQTLLKQFLSAKTVEGCSNKTIKYYKITLEKLLKTLNKKIENITTQDLRTYLQKYKNTRNTTKTTIDNMRRIFSSFFTWLEEEDYILKNPTKRIHKIKTGRTIKETLTDENLETLRDNCNNTRDQAILELLISTGIRVGELVNLNQQDINLQERECKVLGKGESERIVYFNAKTKITLQKYLNNRTDTNPALFVSHKKPHTRLGITGIEKTLQKLGQKTNINKVHPHKFRRTLATNAINKGMPIEQVQKLLGHQQIDTTLQYALVQQKNVKISHQKYIS